MVAETLREQRPSKDESFVREVTEMIREEGFGGYATYVVMTGELADMDLDEAMRPIIRFATYLVETYPELNVLLLSDGPGSNGDTVQIQIGMFGSVGAWEKWWRGSVIDSEGYAFMEKAEKSLVRRWTRRLYTAHVSREHRDVIYKDDNVPDWEKQYKTVDGFLTEERGDRGESPAKSDED